MSKRELQYFHIGSAFGGDQSWFLDPWMHIGGCGALTMCDLLIYMACCKGRPECYPYDPEKLSKRDYKRFGMHMKPYLRPRESGIKRRSIWNLMRSKASRLRRFPETNHTRRRKRRSGTGSTLRCLCRC